VDKALPLCAGGQITCASGRDCGQGEVCCGVYNNTTSSIPQVACASRDKCSGDPPRDSAFVVFCDPNSPQVECGSADACGASQSLKGYFVCTN